MQKNSKFAEFDHPSVTEFNKVISITFKSVTNKNYLYAYIQKKIGLFF